MAPLLQHQPGASAVVVTSSNPAVSLAAIPQPSAPLPAVASVAAPVPGMSSNVGPTFVQQQQPVSAGIQVTLADVAKFSLLAIESIDATY